MAIISIDNIKHENARGILFQNVSFSINEGDRIGIVGNNGSGKSTLIKCIVGELELDSGHINIKKGMKIGYVEQDIPEEIRSESLYNVLKLAIPENEREYSSYRVDIALEILGAPKEIWDLEVAKLSGGWKRLTLIIRAHMKNPDILILDEPTNHLDLGKIIHLEKWLKETVFDVPYIIISHDREFLDNCTNKTIILRDGNVYSFKYSYTNSIKLLEEQDKADEKKRVIQQKEIDRLLKAAKDFKQKGQAHGSERLARVAKTIESRADKIEENLIDIYKEEERMISLGENEIDYNKPILKINNLNVNSPDGRFLFNIEKLEIAKGERIVILGLNGTGKSLLIKNITDKYKELKNDLYTHKKDGISFNSKIEVGYIDQNLSTLPDDETIKDFIQSEFALDTTRAVASVVKIGFPVERQTSRIKDLSFGERTRLAFLKLRHQKPNMYIMDEPTNHLDIDGQLKLQKAILENDNPCIFVSHDRRFVQEVANRYYMIDEKNNILQEIKSPNIFFDKLLKNG